MLQTNQETVTVRQWDIWKTVLDEVLVPILKTKALRIWTLKQIFVRTILFSNLKQPLLRCCVYWNLVAEVSDTTHYNEQELKAYILFKKINCKDCMNKIISQVLALLIEIYLYTASYVYKPKDYQIILVPTWALRDVYILMICHLK